MKLALAFMLLSIAAFGNSFIIGRDDRVAATTHDESTKGLGIVYSYFDDTEVYSSCTGTLISSDFIITAAHCVYNKQAGYAKEVAFVPGQLKSSEGRSERYYAKAVWVLDTFVMGMSLPNIPNNLIYSSDIAIIQIQIVAGRTEWELRRHGIKPMAVDRLKNHQVEKATVLSYPRDKEEQSLWREDSCDYALLNYATFKTNCDGARGASGSALLNQNNEVIGIYSGYNGQYNLFSKISEDIRDEIRVILARLGKYEAEYFKKKTLERSKAYFSLHFANECKRPIYIAAKYKDYLSDEWKTEGFFKLEPGEKFHNIMRTSNRNVYFYAQTYEGDILWEGTSQVAFEGRKLSFYQKTLPEYWTDQTYSWQCD